ncbi:MAG TPA: hypothetical protein VGL55_13460 [Steroidobacteraceae bacterium]|jgi:hypothetical protein
MMLRIACGILALYCVAGLAAPPDTSQGRMQILHHQDVTGKVLKKLGLPARSYCWDECLHSAQCTAVRWGVVKGDTAGLCILLQGELQYRSPVKTTTDDGTEILITTARKSLAGDHPGS